MPGAVVAMTKIRIIPTKPAPISVRIYFRFTRPINMRMIQVTNRMAAVEKLAGRISPHISNTGSMAGRKPFLNSLIFSWFLLSTLAIYMIRNSLATSELCKVTLMMGTVSQRLASFRLVPEIRVTSRRGIVRIRPICERRE